MATFRIALTGGIASGKTAAANEFAALGIPVIDPTQAAVTMAIGAVQLSR